MILPRCLYKAPVYRPCMVEGEGGKVEDAGDVQARIKAKLSPGAWAAYKRITSMSTDEYLEMSNRYSDERMIKEILEEIP